MNTPMPALRASQQRIHTYVAWPIRPSVRPPTGYPHRPSRIHSNISCAHTQYSDLRISTLIDLEWDDSMGARTIRTPQTDAAVPSGPTNASLIEREKKKRRKEN